MLEALFTIGGGPLSSILNGSVWVGCAVVHKTFTGKRRLIHNLFFFNVLEHFYLTSRLSCPIFRIVLWKKYGNLPQQSSDRGGEESQDTPGKPGKCQAKTGGPGTFGTIKGTLSGDPPMGKEACSTRSAAGVRAPMKREMRNAAESRCNNGSSGELSEFILKMLASSRGTTR